MTTEEQDRIIENALIQCDICKDYVPFTHNHHNGMKVEEVGHVCSGCMMAANIFHGMPNANATTLAKAYITKKGTLCRSM